MVDDVAGFVGSWLLVNKNSHIPLIPVLNCTVVSKDFPLLGGHPFKIQWFLLPIEFVSDLSSSFYTFDFTLWELSCTLLYRQQVPLVSRSRFTQHGIISNGFRDWQDPLSLPILLLLSVDSFYLLFGKLMQTPKIYYWGLGSFRMPCKMNGNLSRILLFEEITEHPSCLTADFQD